MKGLNLKKCCQVMVKRTLFEVRRGAFIFNKKKELLVLKNKKDKWGIVGGHLEEGESAEAGLKREIKEETNLEVEIIGILNTQTEKNNFIIRYVTRVITDNLRISSEHKDRKWLKIEALDKYSLSFPEMKINAEKALKYILEWEESNLRID